MFPVGGATGKDHQKSLYDSSSGDHECLHKRNHNASNIFLDF